MIRGNIRYFTMLTHIPEAQVSDTTGADSSNAAKYIMSFFINLSNKWSQTVVLHGNLVASHSCTFEAACSNGSYSASLLKH